MNFQIKVFVGYKISLSLLYEKEEIRGCGHELPDKRKYCGVCGAKAWATAVKPIKGFDPINRKLFGFNCSVSDHVYLYENSMLVTGHRDDVNFGKNVSPSEIEQFRNKVRQSLEKNNLWYDNNFGIFCLVEDRS